MPAAPNFDLTAALEDAEARYAAANPASARAHEAAGRSMPGGNTRTVLFYPPFPLYLARGEGAWVEDVDGHRYVDFVTEQTAALYGHSEPVIMDAVRDALGRGLTLGGPTEQEARLADLLVERFPALELVRFTNSGTEANVLALSTARAATGRGRILAFEGSYHGSVISFGAYGRDLNIPFDVVLGRYNDVDGTEALVREHAGDLAAVILEPMTGSGGCIPATREFLARLRALADEIGFVLIFDEVMTSRLGPGGMHGVQGVTPDMATLGKYVGGGLSFGAFGGRRDIMERFDPSLPGSFGHAGTFNNNVLSMAAGIAGLSKVYTPEAAERLNADGNALRERLNSILAKRGMPAQVTGYGSMMMLHLTDQPLTGPHDRARVPAEARALFHVGMLNRLAYVSRSNMMTLSLPMGAKEHEALVTAFEDWLDEYAPLFTR